MKPSTSCRPVLMLRVISSALLEPQFRSARSSAGLKLAALPRNSRTCLSASGSFVASTACHTTTSVQAWYQTCDAVV